MKKWLGYIITFVAASAIMIALALGLLFTQTENGGLRKAYYYLEACTISPYSLPEIGKLYEVCDASDPSGKTFCLDSKGKHLYGLRVVRWAIGNSKWDPRITSQKHIFVRFYWSRDKPGYLVVAMSVAN